MKLQLIFNSIIIGCAIVTGVLSGINGEVSLPVSFIWLGVVIVSRLHILGLEMRS